MAGDEYILYRGLAISRGANSVRCRFECGSRARHAKKPQRENETSKSERRDTLINPGYDRRRTETAEVAEIAIQKQAEFGAVVWIVNVVYGFTGELAANAATKRGTSFFDDIKLSGAA